MPRDFFDATPEEQVVVLIDATIVHKATLMSLRFLSITSSIELPAPILSLTDYILEQPAKCPNCKREILEKTLVEPA